ncbi:ATP-binding protein [Candidatus Daviesbacteria bacterium]|nr:ATP-binding protein [Candidatus Daviesbacteria bacterium]
MIYPRFIFAQLEKELTTRENLVITGMRRVGKTIALEHLFSKISTSNKVLLDLESPINRKIFETDNFDAIWNNLADFGITNKEKAFILLDEIQNLPVISQVVKYLSDHYDIKFILTGSSSFYLKNLFPESLAGRKIVFEMFPLTFAEFLVFKGFSRKVMVDFAQAAAAKNRIRYERLMPYYQEFMEFGGFPKVVLETNPERKRTLLLDVFKSYFEQDVKTLADFEDTGKLRDLILLLIPRVGGRIEIAKLANSLGVSRQTVYNYLTFLEHTYFVTFLSKFSKSIDRQAAGSKKLYLCDAGMANVLGQVSEGQLFEQAVFQDLRPYYKLDFFYKDASEIDFIIDGGVACEVKTSVSKRDLAHLKAKAKSLNLTAYYVVSKEYSKEEKVIIASDL